jgi:hypothetical protein
MDVVAAMAMFLTVGSMSWVLSRLVMRPTWGQGPC